MNRQIHVILILFLSMLFGLSSLHAQTTVSGRVIDKVTQKEISGVSIHVIGTSQTSISDEEGSFSLPVFPGQQLSFSYIGYVSHTWTIDTISTVLLIELEPDETSLQEVVITGMGMQVDRRLFTGATSKISGLDAQIGGLADASRGLEGRVAGVTVQNVSGTFGTAPKIRVRGATSIYGSSRPLWVVDGIILEDIIEISADDLSSGNAITAISSSIAGINANDIESFQILKDGSATSIYGARAMAGVIVVTTKKGSAGRSAINYVSEYTFRETPNYSRFNILNSQDQMSVYQEIQQKGFLGNAQTLNASSSGIYGKMFELVNRGELENTVSSMNSYLREAEYRNTNWFDLLFNTNIMQNHAISLSSGTDKSQYYASISAINDPGWTKQSDVQRYTANLNANYHIFDNLQLNLISTSSYRTQHMPGSLAQEVNVVEGEVRRDYDINPYLYALNTSRVLDPNEFYTRSYAPFNILHELDNNFMQLDIADVKFQGELRWKIKPNWEVSGLASLRYQNSSQQHFVLGESNQASAYRMMPTTIIRDVNPLLYRDPDNPFANPISVLPEGGIYHKTDYRLLTNDFRLSSQYHTLIEDKHDIILYGATQINSLERSNNWFQGWGMQYDIGEIPFFDYQIFKRSQEENTQYYHLGNTRSREIAFVGNGTYAYDGKYVVNGSYRYEGTNRLGRARTARWLPSWNISAAWNVHEEEFFKNLEPYVSHLMLKSSYSLVGDRGPSTVTNSLPVIVSYNPWRPSTVDGESGLTVSDLENSDLTYEKKYEWNIGLSAGFLKNRINVEVDWFRRDNFDLIGIINTQGVGGEMYKFGNVANMQSQGTELSLTAKIFERPNFSWTSNLIYTHVTTNITSLQTRSRVIDLISRGGFAQEGRPNRALFSIPFIGLNDEGLPRFSVQNGEETVSGINFQEREEIDFLTYEGSVDPTDLGSWGNVLRYKNFSLNVFITYSFGNVVRLDPVFSNSYNDLNSLTREFNNRWVVPGDENFTNVPVIASTVQNRVNNQLSYAYNAYNYSSERIARGDFIRLKDIALSYDLSPSLLSKWKINSLGLRLNATNLFLLYADRKLNGQDPEFVNTGGIALPIPRQYTLTFKLGI